MCYRREMERKVEDTSLHKVFMREKYKKEIINKMSNEKKKDRDNFPSTKLVNLNMRWREM